ncbi:restriction endonuclease-like protein [Paenibacillus profundus]|uniref:Restriction endonuclease-like protein n=1 Tax=Paenibacillus profundus TaxID=1173085 RepID=A0ABS8YV83_9BACL|nr:restriction endonuclease-like protein [Paenibacillus profundus]MCE5173529.1 restriction endonuclease-like protein [Paenibacillus profundus]
MASPHTGSLKEVVELLRIDTNLFTLYIQGKPFHPTVETLQLHRDAEQELVDAHVHVSAASPIQVEGMYLYSPVDGDMRLWQEGDAWAPLFYETQAYELVVEKKEELPLTFHHEHVQLRNAVRPLGSRILSGILRFTNEIGLTELELQLHGESVLRIQLEIFPSKMDYKRDYLLILNDVNAQISNLAFDFLRKTFHLSGLKETKHQSLTEFFVILQHLFAQLVQAVERIQAAPHTKLQSEYRKVEAARVRRADKGNAAYLAKRPHLLREDGPNGVITINDKRYTPSHLLEQRRQVSFDTAENRFVRWVFLRIEQKLKRIKASLMKMQRTRDEHLLRRLDQMNNQIRRVLQHDFLQVGEMRQMSISLVLQMAPGYREVYRYYLMLMKGLSIQTDLFRLSMKDLAQLYEYWCFLKIHHLLSEKYELIQQDIIKVNRGGLFVTLDQSRKAKVKYRNPRNGEEFTLYYNALPAGEVSKTLSQRPDTVLTLKKNESATEYKYIFDAKYRLNPAYKDTPYWTKYKQPGPEEEDINTMHRYRDAIVYEDTANQTYERSMFGAYVLFPYADEEKFQQHRFYKSIELINIGALPFLPNATKLMEQFLDEIIEDSPEKAYERSTRPRGTEHYYTEKLAGKNVLVGALGRTAVKQLEAALANRYYHVPLQQITDHRQLTQIEYVALYQSMKQFGSEAGIRYYGRVQEWKVLPRREITYIESSRGAADELYVLFTVEEWQEREQPIVPGGHYVYHALFTAKPLFDRAQEVAELRLESEADIRVWREARRQGKAKVKLDQEPADLATRVTQVVQED